MWDIDHGINEIEIVTIVDIFSLILNELMDPMLMLNHDFQGIQWRLLLDAMTFHIPKTLYNTSRADIKYFNITIWNTNITNV